jgi:hypothetical protein
MPIRMVICSCIARMISSEVHGEDKNAKLQYSPVRRTHAPVAKASGPHQQRGVQRNGPNSRHFAWSRLHQPGSPYQPRGKHKKAVSSTIWPMQLSYIYFRHVHFGFVISSVCFRQTFPCTVAQLARTCKAILELDRAQAAEEEGYRVRTHKLFDPGCTAKYHVLLGLPSGIGCIMAPE